MATVRKLICRFMDSDGAKMSLTFSYIKAGYTAQAVKTLMDTIITNGSIYQRVPVVKVSAEVKTEDTTEVDIEE